jgi:hypothetical protein
MDIAALQARLADHGQAVSITGIYDASTRVAIMAALTDGPDYVLADADAEEAAVRLGATAAQVWTVYDVEAGGSPFLNGRPSILFEPHRFSRATGHIYDASHPNISSRVWNRKLYPASQQGRWDQLLEAVELNVDAGFASASYGGFQILGENYKLCGAISPWAFAWTQSQTTGDQLDAFVNFVSNAGLAPKLRNISANAVTCKPFANGYNGTASAQNQYAEKLASRYALRHQSSKR